MKKLAILIPTYQPKEYFRRSLNSIENQTLSKNKFCVYIALNGPKKPYEDYIFDILKEMTFCCRYIYLEKSGVSNARNRLLDYSEEEFITFIDDDDVISKNYLEGLLDVSTKQYIGISNVYGFEFDIDNLKKNYIGCSYIKLEKFETSKFKIRKYFSSPWAKIIHREMIGDIRFDIKLKNDEDSLFMAMISKNITGIHKSNFETYYYVYERLNSASRKKRSLYDKVNTCRYLLKKYFSLLKMKEYNKVFILTRIAATLKNTLKN